MVVARLRLYATLRKYAPEAPIGGNVEITLTVGSTIADLSQLLKIPPSEVRLAFVNNLRQEDSYVIQDGDEIVLFPPVAGGS